MQQLVVSHILLVVVLLNRLSICTSELSVTVSDYNDSRLAAWYPIRDDAEPTDLLALLPATASVATTSPLRYVFVESSLWTPNRRAAAEFALPNDGVDDLQLVHLRGSALFTSNLTAAAPTAVLSSHPLPGSSSRRNTPAQCRLVFTRRPGELRVLWRSKTPGSPVVRFWFGSASGNHSSQQFGAVGTFTAGDMCGAPAATSGFISPQTINTAVLRKLHPNTTYFYRVGDEAHGFSPEHSFTTPPAAAGATDASPVRLLAAADLGTFSDDGAETVSASLALQAKVLGRLAAPGSLEFALIRAALTATGAVTPAPGSRGTQKQMRRLLVDKQHHGLLLLGGVSMAAGQAAGWDDFLEQMQPVLAQVPLAAAAGDTESADRLLRGQVHNSSASGGECGVAYEQLLRMPHTERFDQWWATNIGPVHVVMLNSEQNLTKGSPQYNFLESDLRAVDRSITPWVIVGTHRGLYVDDPATQAPDGAAHIAVTLRQQLEPLLAERQVDLVLSGHGRKFHRSCPVMKGVCVGFDDEGAALGPMHVMLGSAGAAVPLSAWAVQPEWLDEAAVFEHSFAQLAVSRTTLDLEVISSRTGKQLSQLLLKKPRHWVPDPEAAEQLYANAVARPELRGTNTSALVELLQEDVVAAALVAPSQQLRQVFGPGGSLAQLLSSLPMADAPSVADVWQVTSQLMQLVLNVMGSNPAAAAAAAPGAQQPAAVQGTSQPAATAPCATQPLPAGQAAGSSGSASDTAAQASPPAGASAATAASPATAARLGVPQAAALPPSAAAAAPPPTKPGTLPVSAAPDSAATPAARDKPAPAGVAMPGPATSTHAKQTSPVAGQGAVLSAPATAQDTTHKARPLKPSPAAAGAAAKSADRKPLPGKAPGSPPATKHAVPPASAAATGAPSAGLRPTPQPILAVKAKPKPTPSFVVPPAATGSRPRPAAATKSPQPPPEQGTARFKTVSAPKAATKQAAEAVEEAPEVEVVELPSPAAAPKAADDAGWLVWAPPARSLKAQQQGQLPPTDSHGAGAADALQAALQAQMAENLVLRRVDGMPVPPEKVEAFVYHWLLLQGRLQGLKGSS